MNFIEMTEKLNDFEDLKISTNLNARNIFSMNIGVFARRPHWTPNTKLYDFDTKTWYPNDSAEYYIATDMNNNLCIVNSKKELVHKTDIVVDKLITSAYVSSDDEILTVIMEDSTAYNINIKTFEYNKYKYASGY